MVNNKYGIQKIKIKEIITDILFSELDGMTAQEAADYFSRIQQNLMDSKFQYFEFYLEANTRLSSIDINLQGGYLYVGIRYESDEEFAERILECNSELEDIDQNIDSCKEELKHTNLNIKKLESVKHIAVNDYEDLLEDREILELKLERLKGEKNNKFELYNKNQDEYEDEL